MAILDGMNGTRIEDLFVPPVGPPAPEPSTDEEVALLKARLRDLRARRNHWMALASAAEHKLAEMAPRMELLAHDLAQEKARADAAEARAAMYQNARDTMSGELFGIREAMEAIRKDVENGKALLMAAEGYALALHAWDRGDIGSGQMGDRRFDLLKAAAEFGRRNFSAVLALSAEDEEMDGDSDGGSWQ